jgi:hypothetical protein
MVLVSTHVHKNACICGLCLMIVTLGSMEQEVGVGRNLTLLEQPHKGGQDQPCWGEQKRPPRTVVSALSSLALSSILTFDLPPGLFFFFF